MQSHLTTVPNATMWDSSIRPSLTGSTESHWFIYGNCTGKMKKKKQQQQHSIASHQFTCANTPVLALFLLTLPIESVQFKLNFSFVSVSTYVFSFIQYNHCCEYVQWRLLLLCFTVHNSIECCTVRLNISTDFRTNASLLFLFACSSAKSLLGQQKTQSVFSISAQK